MFLAGQRPDLFGQAPILHLQGRIMQNDGIHPCSLLHPRYLHEALQVDATRAQAVKGGIIAGPWFAR